MRLAQFTIDPTGTLVFYAPEEVMQIAEMTDGGTMILAECLGTRVLSHVREDVHVVQLRLNRISSGMFRRELREQILKPSQN